MVPIIGVVARLPAVPIEITLPDPSVMVSQNQRSMVVGDHGVMEVQINVRTGMLRGNVNERAGFGIFRIICVLEGLILVLKKYYS